MARRRLCPRLLGDHLAEKLRELRLGLHVEVVERVTVDCEWIEALSRI